MNQLRSAECGSLAHSAKLINVGVSPREVYLEQRLKGGFITQLRRYFVRPTVFIVISIMQVGWVGVTKHVQEHTRL